MIVGLGNISLLDNTLSFVLDLPLKNIEPSKKIANDPAPITLADHARLSPKNQIKMGVDLLKIDCNDDLVLIQKYDGSPACIKPESILKLIERGWAQNTTQENISSMMERGDIAMGFNQTKIMHHFMSTPIGGEIMIVAINENDTKTISEIRAHVKDIEYEFSQGNFTKPFFIHDQIVPGSQAMAENKDKIQYSTMQIDRGSVLILATNDTDLLYSIQQFMDFQSSQHIGH